MRDGGWSKNTTAREGWRVTKVANRERAVSEYQRTQNEKLSVPKRVAEKYEDKLRQTRQGFEEQ
jgi:hypothetical protein